jgi:pyruvate formate lyase activating enzyme
MSWRRKLLDFDTLSNSGSELKGLVFDLQKFAIHDGGGIRTVVFLKGCPLSCAWCANPESIKSTQEMNFIPNNCIGCEKCFAVCPQQAISQSSDRPVMPVVDKERCTLCGKCLKSCYAGALNIIGRHVSVAELMTMVERDRKFYDQSGGGVTFSGGEPLAQAGFLLAALQEARLRGIHTAIETNGFLQWEKLEPVLQYVDLALVDIKHMDTEQHAVLTGMPNGLILDNLQRMAAIGLPVRIRLPLIPGCNDSLENMQATAKFVKGLSNVQAVDILPYHRLGEMKWAQLDSACERPALLPPEEGHVQQRAEIFRTLGLKVSVGG